VIQDLSYTYEIKSVNKQGRFMEVVYFVEGKQPITTGVRLPFENESLEAVIYSHSPVRYFIEEMTPVIDVLVGTTGAYVIPEKTLQSVKETKQQEIALWRYEQETKGIAINNKFFSTSRESQAALTAAFTSLKEGFISSVNWKTLDGTFVNLNLQNIIAIAQAVVNHVQLCFDKEAEYLNLVKNATTIEEVENIILE
jgi:hypothetical protein